MLYIGKHCSRTARLIHWSPFVYASRRARRISDRRRRCAVQRHLATSQPGSGRDRCNGRSGTRTTRQRAQNGTKRANYILRARRRHRHVVCVSPGDLLCAFAAASTVAAVASATTVAAAAFTAVAPTLTATTIAQPAAALALATVAASAAALAVSAAALAFAQPAAALA